MSNTGRHKGSSNNNPIQVVYRLMKEHGTVPAGMTRTELMHVLRTVGEKMWDLVYEGHIVAVPGLFNMEIRPNKLKWPRRVDWKRTLKLWDEDDAAKEDKLLVRAVPTQNYLRIKHSTIGSTRKRWYYPLMIEIRPCKGKMKMIEDRYML